jgi:hypothetical protein
VGDFLRHADHGEWWIARVGDVDSGIAIARGEDQTTDAPVIRIKVESNEKCSHRRLKEKTRGDSRKKRKEARLLWCVRHLRLP